MKPHQVVHPQALDAPQEERRVCLQIKLSCVLLLMFVCVYFPPNLASQTFRRTDQRMHHSLMTLLYGLEAKRTCFSDALLALCTLPEAGVSKHTGKVGIAPPHVEFI
jgi:hypothetical protein